MTSNVLVMIDFNIDERGSIFEISHVISFKVGSCFFCNKTPSFYTTMFAESCNDVMKNGNHVG